MSGLKKGKVFKWDIFYYPSPQEKSEEFKKFYGCLEGGMVADEIGWVSVVRPEASEGRNVDGGYLAASTLTTI